MMAGVWRLVLRLPPAIGKNRVAELAARAVDEVDALSPRQRAIHHLVVRELPGQGKPMPPETIAATVGLSTDEVTRVLADLESRKGFLFRNEDGAVAWAYPVTSEPTPHRLHFKSGETLYAA
jgi:hypothetical protein